MRGREDVDLVLFVDRLRSERVDRGDALDLVAEELDADRVLLIHRVDLQGVAFHLEGAAAPAHVVAPVLDVHEVAQQVVAVVLVAHAQGDALFEVLLRGAEAIDGGHGGDDDHVATREQRAGGGVPHALYLFVERRILLDVGVRLRDVRLGLVVVVVGDEVLDCVVGEEIAQLRGELCGQRLVRLHDQHRALEALGQPSDRGRLARAGRAQHDDVLLAGFEAAFEFLDRAGLIAGWLEIRVDLERCHLPLEFVDGAHETSLRCACDSFLRQGCRRR